MAVLDFQLSLRMDNFVHAGTMIHRFVTQHKFLNYLHKYKLFQHYTSQHIICCGLSPNRHLSRTTSSTMTSDADRCTDARHHPSHLMQVALLIIDL